MAKINKIYQLPGTHYKPCVFQRMLKCDDVSQEGITNFDTAFHVCLNPDYAPPGFLEDLDMMIQKARDSHLVVECRNFPEICTCDVVINYVRMEADK